MTSSPGRWRCPGPHHLASAPAEEPAALAVARRGRRPPPDGSQQRVDLGLVGPADRNPVQPLQVLEISAGDLAQRPSGIAAEAEQGPRRVAGGGPAEPYPWAVPIVRGSYPPPALERPVVQSGETRSVRSPGSVVRMPAIGHPGPCPPELSRRGLPSPVPAAAPVAGPAAGGRGRVVRTSACASAAVTWAEVAASRTRARSTAARRIGSRSISQAWLISTIRPCASGPVAMSGWYLRARRR